MQQSSYQPRVLNETEKRIREVALRLFAQKGFEATSTREIAAEAGLTVAGLYYYVGTKEELLLHIVLDISNALLRSAVSISAGNDSAEQKLARLVQLHVWFHGAYAQASRVVDIEIRALTGEAREQAQRIRDQYEAEWRSAVAQGNAAGVFEGQDAKLAAIALIEMGRGISHWYNPHGNLSLPDICHMYVDWALGLLRATRDGKPLRASDLNLGNPAELYLA